MEGHEVFWEIGDKISKNFESMTNEEKKQQLNNLLNKVERSSGIDRLNNKREMLSEDKKLQIYNKWDISNLRAPLKNILSNSLLTPKKEKNNLITGSILNTIAPVCRFFIQLWILKKPNWLTEKQLKKDIKKDAKFVKNNLIAFDLVCKVVPELAPALPYIKMIKPYVNRYKKHWTEVLISRLIKDDFYTTVDTTNKNLLDDLSNVA